MIGWLEGSVIDRSESGCCTLNVQGVGYEVFVPLRELAALPPAPETVGLYVHTHVREDALTLFGFSNPLDRQAFRTLIHVSSVGPKLAHAILSDLSAGDLSAVVQRGDTKRIRGIAGVGKKTAERLVLELQDRLPAAPAMPARAPAEAQPTPSMGGSSEQVTEMLVKMGFTRGDAERAVRDVHDEHNGQSSVETLLRRALQVLA